MKIDYLRGLLKYEMPQELSNKIISFIDAYSGNPDEEKLQIFIKEVRAKRSYKLPREEIEWYPTILKDQCTNCYICYEFCKRKVYALDENHQVYVDKPYECVMMCCGCKKKCSNGAIEFPNKEEFQKYIYYK